MTGIPVWSILILMTNARFQEVLETKTITTAEISATEMFEIYDVLLIDGSTVVWALVFDPSACECKRNICLNVVN